MLLKAAELKSPLPSKIPAGSWEGTCGSGGDVTCTSRAAVGLADPGLLFFTEIRALPTCAGVAVPVAMSWEAELKVVCSGTPANRTWAPFTNLLPFMVRLKYPTDTVVGETEVRIGIGL